MRVIDADDDFLELAPFGQVLSARIQDVLPYAPQALRDWLNQAWADDSAPLNRLYAASLDIERTGARLTLRSIIVIPEQLTLELPGMPDFAITIGSIAGDYTAFDMTLMADIRGPKIAVILQDIGFGLRLPAWLLKPIVEGGGTSEQPVALTLRGNIAVDQDLNVSLVGFDSFSLPRCLVGESGVEIWADHILLDTSGQSVALGEVGVKLPEGFPTAPELALKNARIGPRGLSGEATVAWDLKYDPGAAENDGLVGRAVGTLFDAFSFGMREVSLEFDKNQLTKCEVHGLMVIPAMSPDPLDVSVNIASGGEVSIAIGGLGDVLTLSRDQLFELRAESVGFRRTAEEVAFTASGDFHITHPSVVDVIPTIGLKGFTVYRKRGGDWQFRVEGGSVKVNKSFDLFGVARVDISEIVLGLRDSKSIFGFTGGVSLLEGVDAGAWVDGLRLPFTLQPFAVEALTVDGLGLRVAVPDTFEFEGSIKKKGEAGKSYFEGDIALDILPIQMGIRGSLKIGKSQRCRFALVRVALNIAGPGYPLGSLPLYVRSLDGINAINMTPDANGIRDYLPLGQRQPLGLSHPGKWRDQCNDAAIGFGVGVATANQKLLTMKALLIYLFRPRTLLIEGKAWVLTEPKGDPLFYSILALDIDDLTALINISAKGDFFKGVLSVDAMMEAYYGPDDANPSQTTSYFALGQKKPYFPHDRLVSAKYLKLFTGNGYVIIVPGVWAIGASIGLPKKRIDVGFASINFKAHMGGAAVLTWGPTQFKGDLDLDGAVGFRIFGKGFDLSLGANVKGRTPDWLIDALLKFGIRFRLGWKKIEREGELPFHWEKRRTPRIAKVLDTILLQHPVTGRTVAPLLTQNTADRLVVPVVEPDMCPAIAFRFPVKDRTGLPFGQNVANVSKHKTGVHEFVAELPAPEDGDWTKAGIVLERIPLAEWPSDNWQAFEAPSSASSVTAAASAGKTYLFGAWQADQAPDGSQGATHLHLFARTPFDFNRMNRFPRVTAGRLFVEQLVSLGAATAPPNTALGSAAASAFIDQTLDTSSPLGATGNPSLSVPAYSSKLNDPTTLRGQNQPLPHRGAQVAIIEEPTYPRSGVKMDSSGRGVYVDSKPVPAEGTSEDRCMNFLGTTPRFYSPKESVLVDHNPRSAVSAAVVHFGGEVMVGGYAWLTTKTRERVLVGTCEVIQERTTPYEFRALLWHADRGITLRNGPIVYGQLAGPGIMKIVLRPRVRRLTIHYQALSRPVSAHPTVEEREYSRRFTSLRETRFKTRAVAQLPEPIGKAERVVKPRSSCAPDKPFAFRAAYRKAFAVSTFWASGTAVSPAPLVDMKTSGMIVITARPGAAPFNEVVFEMCGSAKVLSLCYETDVSDELATIDDQLDTYVDLTFPRRSIPTGTSTGAGGGTGTSTGPGATGGTIIATAPAGTSWVVPGPAALDAPAFGIAVGAIVPGFVYRLTVRTDHSRLKENATGPQRRNYYALFQVTKPPSDLAPYVMQNFPEEAGFPHYRSYEHYIRFSRNYVHRLAGDLNGRIEARILVNGDAAAPKSTLPFRDGADADLATLLTPSAVEKKGWGWGKANGHAVTTEEEIWIQAFNRTAPAGEQIDGSMALPDDMIWAYVANPVRHRSDFTASSTEAIEGFDVATDGVGASISARWSTSGALLRHTSVAPGSDASAPQAADSYLLTAMGFDEAVIVSAWIRPHARTGHVSLILAADVPAERQIAQHFAIRLDLAGGRILFLDVRPGVDPTQRVLGERRFTFSIDRWYRTTARLAEVSGVVAVTVSFDEQQLFSVTTDLTGSTGRAGFGASADFSGSFDNLEVLSVSRLARLPEPGVPNHLSIVYREAGTETEMYRNPFTPSRFIDLFDHLNSWNRRVQRWPTGPSHSGCDPDARLRLPDSDGVVRCSLSNSLAAWDTARNNFVTALGSSYHDKGQYALKLRTLADVDVGRQRLRDCRYDLDLAFEELAAMLGLELAARPENFEFILAHESRGLLVQSPEPIDWTRISAGEVKRVDVAANGTRIETSVSAKLVYSSDLTRAILLLTSDGIMIDQFELGTTYLWTIKQNFVLPPHLSWLNGWVTHRKETHVVTLETPV